MSKVSLFIDTKADLSLDGVGLVLSPSKYLIWNFLFDPKSCCPLTSWGKINLTFYFILESGYMKTFQIEIGCYELDVALYVNFETKYRSKNEKQRLWSVTYAHFINISMVFRFYHDFRIHMFNYNAKFHSVLCHILIDRWF